MVHPAPILVKVRAPGGVRPGADRGIFRGRTSLPPYFGGGPQLAVAAYVAGLRLEGGYGDACHAGGTLIGRATIGGSRANGGGGWREALG